jgi:hypothetical protein
MNLSERLTVFLLTCFDHVMNIVTSGLWEKVRGEQIVIIKIRKQN